MPNNIKTIDTLTKRCLRMTEMMQVLIQHPDLEVSYVTDTEMCLMTPTQEHGSAVDPEALAELLRRVRSITGQPVAKEPTASLMEYRSTMHPEEHDRRWRINVLVWRNEVCTPRVVGTRTVEKVDPEAPTITIEEDIVEWDCHPLLDLATQED